MSRFVSKPKVGPNVRFGVLGGGQLGRMLIQAAIDLDVHVAVLDASPDAPCHHLSARFVCGDVRSADAVFEFGRSLDVVTIEVEDVSVEGLSRLEALGVRVVPKAAHVAMIQDKALQKRFFAENNVPTAAFQVSDDVNALKKFPVVQKVRRGGYDGRGVVVLETEADAQIKKFPGECVLEEKVDILKEVSVIVARRKRGDVATYAPAETVFDARANVAICIAAPADVDPSVAAKCEAVAVDLVEKLDFVGLLAVELFVVDDSERTVLVNEVAPRCHNSGHHTIEACATSQFAMLLRVALDLPLGPTSKTRPHAATINLLGDATTLKGPPVYFGLDDALADPDVYPHLYGKTTVSPFRKMGHVTVCGPSRDTVQAKVAHLRDRLGCAAASHTSAASSSSPGASSSQGPRDTTVGDCKNGEDTLTGKK